jgi:predicted nucleic acid-binding protein
MVFADTSFWIAVSSQRDQYHSAAIAWARHLMAGKNVVVTTEAVLWEWLNAMAGPSTRAAAAEGYRRTHRDSQVQVVAGEEKLIESAVELYRTREDKHWSLTDCLSFVVMTQRQIGEALTFDYHFQQAGFRSLLRESPPPG